MTHICICMPIAFVCLLKCKTESPRGLVEKVLDYSLDLSEF